MGEPMIDADIAQPPPQIGLEQADEGADVPPERAQFANNCELILALVSFAVGLGNIWRFPYLAFDNGGGTFLIPYAFALFALGLPLFILELGMGQLLREGIVNVWVRLDVPKIRGVGIAATITSFLICFYYIVIVTWTLYYMFRTFGAIGDGVVPWSDEAEGYSCPPTYLFPKDEIANNSDLWDERGVYNSAYKTDFFCGDSSLDNWSLPGADTSPPDGFQKKEVDATVCPSEAAVNFFNNEVLKISSSITDLGGLHWGMIVPFTICWILAYILVFKGVELSGKLVYITSTTPYVCLVAFFLRAVTLENAGNGLWYYIKPDWSKLGDPVVWQRATTQIFYSLSVGIGGIVAFGSYGDRKSDYPLHVVRVAFINCGTSIFAGVVVFAILGFLANELSLVNPCFEKDKIELLKEVGISGPGLAFIAFPIAIARMPGSFLWGILFFVMLFFLGLGSTFPFIESVVTVLNDAGYGEAQGIQRWQMAAVICVAGYVLGFIFMTYAGEYWVTLFDTYVSVVSLLFVGCLECVGIMWLNPQIWPNMVRVTKEITSRDLSLLTCLLKFVGPLVMAVMMILSVSAWDLTGKSEDDKFPDGLLLFGWFLGLLPIVGFFFAFFMEPKADVPVATEFLSDFSQGAEEK